MNEVGVVAALAAEARSLGFSKPQPDGTVRLGDGTLVMVSGMGMAGAQAAAHSLLEAGARALMSFGLAGGLDPGLRAGSIILPTEVVAADGERFVTSIHWRESLGAALATQCRLTSGRLLTSARPIDTVAAKAAAFTRTGAVAVDMESAAVGRAAAEREVPFVAVRAIVDTALDELPPAVIAASVAGKVRLLRLVRGLAMAPGELPAVLRLVQRYRAALRSLSSVGEACRLTQFQAVRIT